MVNRLAVAGRLPVSVGPGVAQPPELATDPDLAIWHSVWHGVDMPTITGRIEIDCSVYYEVDGVVRAGIVEDATWQVETGKLRLWLLDGRPHRMDGPAIIRPAPDMRLGTVKGSFIEETGPRWFR